MRSLFTPAARRLIAIVIAVMLALAVGVVVGSQDDRSPSVPGGIIGSLDHLDQ